MERYNLGSLIEVKVSKECQVKIWNRICSCGDSDGIMGIDRGIHSSVL